MFEVMFPGFVISVLLIGMHSYLGLHILKRGVIFVDLALAQLAACGAVIGLLFGFPLHSSGSYFTSLFTTLIGAFIFALTRNIENKEIPQEAIIGIVYVVGASLSVLILDRIPSETEHIKEMLVGNILFVNWEQIKKTLFLYSLIGLIHYIFRNKFISISFNQNRDVINVKLWDFIFYSLFGIVVVSSVELAGVFLVFSFLIIPAVMSTILVKELIKRIIVSWFLGFIMMVIGLFVSVRFDTPTGVTIVVVFGFSLILVWLLKHFLMVIR